MSSAPDAPASPETVVPVLTQAIGHILRRLRAEANPGGLNVSQTAALGWLDENGAMTTADLARAEAMTPQSMSAILASLEQEGLVERRPHPTDGRQILFSLTAQGLEARRMRSTAKQQWLLAALAKLGPDERQTLLAAARLIRGLGGDSPPACIESTAMTVTALDPKTALVVIDLQQGLISLPSIHPIATVVANAAALAAAFRQRGLPVVLVNVAGAPAVRTERPRRIPALADGWTELIPELNRQPQDHLVTKMTPGAFTHTDLEAHLRSLGVTQIVIAGIATGGGVEATARQAYELGFNTTLAIDAMTDVDPEAHAYSVTRVFPKLGETGATADIIALLQAGA